MFRHTFFWVTKLEMGVDVKKDKDANKVSLLSPAALSKEQEDKVYDALAALAELEGFTLEDMMSDVEWNEPFAEMANVTNDNMKDFTKKVEDIWVGRAEHMDYGKPKSAKYRSAQADFFCGAMAAFHAVGIEDGRSTPPKWYICLIRGEEVASA